MRSLDGVPTRFAGVDLVIVRENTEGLYSGAENRVTDDVVITGLPEQPVEEATSCFDELSMSGFLHCFHKHFSAHPDLLSQNFLPWRTDFGRSLFSGLHDLGRAPMSVLGCGHRPALSSSKGEVAFSTGP